MVYLKEILLDYYDEGRDLRTTPLKSTTAILNHLPSIREAINNFVCGFAKGQENVDGLSETDSESIAKLKSWYESTNILLNKIGEIPIDAYIDSDMAY